MRRRRLHCVVSPHTHTLREYSCVVGREVFLVPPHELPVRRLAPELFAELHQYVSWSHREIGKPEHASCYESTKALLGILSVVHRTMKVEQVVIHGFLAGFTLSVIRTVSK